MTYQEFIDAHITASARKYADGLERSGLAPNLVLSKAMAERAVREAHAAYCKRYPWRAALRNVRLVVSCPSALVAAANLCFTLVRHQGLLLIVAWALCIVFCLIMALVAYRRGVVA